MAPQLFGPDYLNGIYMCGTVGWTKCCKDPNSNQDTRGSRQRPGINRSGSVQKVPHDETHRLRENESRNDSSDENIECLAQDESIYIGTRCSYRDANTDLRGPPSETK